MIDYFTIALTHGLIAIAAWRLLFRDDLDRDAQQDETGGAKPAGNRTRGTGSDA